MAVGNTNGYRTMLLTISDLIKADELSNIKFYCKDFIPSRKRDTIKAGTDFFDVLEENDKLSEYNLSYLKRVLEDAAKRKDLVKIVEKYEQSLTISFSELSLHQSLRSTIYFLQTKLGVDYKFFFRHIGLPDHILEMKERENPRSVRECIHQCFNEWLHANETCSHKELLSSIIAALKQEKRLDLVHKIENGDLS